jgi:hypothetical protein
MSTLLIAAAVWLGGVAFASRFGHIVDTATRLALVGCGTWIAVAALREMRPFGSSGTTHHHGHHHSAQGAYDDTVHGREQQRFATEDRELKLSIFERGRESHFRLSGAPIDTARVETLRINDATQLFKFENRGTYWE